MTERLLMIDSAKTVLETIKVTARLSRTEQEAIDFAIDELGKKEDLLETIKDIKDNVYLQGKEVGARNFAEWLCQKSDIGYVNCKDFATETFDIIPIDEVLAEWQKGDLNDRLF